MRRLVVALALLVAATPAEGEPSRRVVLADPNPELERSLASVLAPWRMEVVVDTAPIPDTKGAEARAKDRDARFVVWRRSGDLVVYDQSRGSAEFRDGKVGALDAADATAAALTVKTLMRLPPPEQPEPVRPPPPVEEIERLRIQIGFGARIDGEVAGRAIATIMVRPTRRPWRLGIAADLGPSIGVSRSNFRGDVQELGASVLASWQARVRRFGIEPFVGVGVRRSTLEGEEAGMPRSESSTFVTLQTGAWGQLPLGRWLVGPTIAVEVSPDAPSYPRLMGNGDIYQTPGFSIHLGAFAAVGL